MHTSDGRVLFVPVRHHSPACARAVRRLALELRPAALLIEGPSDFNPRIGELALPHELPIAIYSYVRLPDGARRGAFHPFCAHSPEWEALRVARDIGAQARFIDLPWAALATPRIAAHRYGDGELRRSPYIPTLCRKLGLEDFDSLWDTLVEIDGALEPAQLLERVGQLCYHIRATSSVSREDLRREAFMAGQIRAALAEFDGPLLVVTGGFHTSALIERLAQDDRRPTTDDQRPTTNDQQPPVGEPDGDPPSFVLRPSSHDDQRPATDDQRPSVGELGGAPSSFVLRPSSEGESDPSSVEQGIALTPFSDARLDSLAGYEAGMPSPGFYAAVWEDRSAGRTGSYRRMLAAAVEELRRRGQVASTADLIAVETCAQALAALRGHAEVWRRDLVDAIIGALVKEAIDRETRNPFLEALLAVFRGARRGRLAEGVSLPPLVHDIQAQLRAHGLQPDHERERSVELDLLERAGLARSRVLHRLRVLEVRGFARQDGTDLLARDDLARIWERWGLAWMPEQESDCIEAAIYGATLEDAAAARLEEQADTLAGGAQAAARLLLDACLMGMGPRADDLFGRMTALVREDSDFFSVAAALGHLLYLYRYDQALGALGRSDLGALLAETFRRALWLLEALGHPQGHERELLRGVGALVQTYESSEAALALDRDTLVEVLRRVGGAPQQHPLTRGAATGALWTLGAADAGLVQADMRACVAPERLGDFLTGLFALARETAQRHPELVLSIDALLMGYDDHAYLHALPALRLAFTYFTPREKIHMVRTLREVYGQGAAPLPRLSAGADTAARAMALESWLFGALERYGIRGGTP